MSILSRNGFTGLFNCPKIEMPVLSCGINNDFVSIQTVTVIY